MRGTTAPVAGLGRSEEVPPATGDQLLALLALLALVALLAELARLGGPEEIEIEGRSEEIAPVRSALLGGTAAAAHLR